MNVSLLKPARSAAAKWEASDEEIVIGKDVLELLSSSMYLDPITIFREYVQNSADAIDEARHKGIINRSEPGRVDIRLDPIARTIQLRDNGSGIPSEEFTKRLTSFGASTKRGTTARGFRGVGRLAGLGYCQELIFRSRAPGDAMVSELRWDCRRLRSALRDISQQGDLISLVHEVVSTRRLDGEPWPTHFFEVELKGVIRHRNDRLLSASTVAEYLSQVAPVPFSPLFKFGAEIAEVLSKVAHMGDLELRIVGIDGPITRPHQDRLEIGDNRFDEFKEIEFKEIPAHDGGVAAIAWFLHHGYVGAIPAKAQVKGLRLRAGNVQVGDGALLEDLFAEPRFNAWSVGEIHVLDKRITPNGRRDQFEQSVHFDNLLNHVAPVARDISRRCRTSSAERKLQRDFQFQEKAVRESTGILAQGTLSGSRKSKLVKEAQRGIDAMERIAARIHESDRDLNAVVKRMRAKLEKLSGRAESNPFDKLPKKEREMYEHLFGLIYDCSTNRIAAKALIDRIIGKVL